ncbi:transposable element Tc1 transposase [Trichonephila clavipes]|nr:transposable element Tc1 transposase [Trichonephila clavipes]
MWNEERLSFQESALSRMELKKNLKKRDGTDSRPRGNTKKEDKRIWLTGWTHRIASEVENQTEVGITVTQRTDKNQLLQGQFRARCSVAYIPLTASHLLLRRQLCQMEDGEEICSVVSDETRFCLGASDGMFWSEGGKLPAA